MLTRERDEELVGRYSATSLDVLMSLADGIITWIAAAAHEVPQELGDNIGASGLIPEVKHDQRLRDNIIHFGAFVGGISVIVVPGCCSKADMNRMPDLVAQAIVGAEASV